LCFQEHGCAWNCDSNRSPGFGSVSGLADKGEDLPSAGFDANLIHSRIAFQKLFALSAISSSITLKRSDRNSYEQ
jgi:hypothetical protein